MLLATVTASGQKPSFKLKPGDCRRRVRSGREANKWPIIFFPWPRPSVFRNSLSRWPI